MTLVESLGLDVTYVTDTDLQASVNPLVSHKAVISLGHDEYYSLAMRQALEQARDQGRQSGVPRRQRHLPAHPPGRLAPRSEPSRDRLQVGR